MLGSLKSLFVLRLITDSKFLSGFWGPLVILLCFHQLYYGWILIQSNFVPYVMDGNETFSVFWHSHNLYNYSFWKSFGLTDEAFSWAASAHPFFHTHQGNMPRLFGFLIYALGARTIETQVLITTLIIGNLTLFFCYAALGRLTRPLIAFLFCVFLFSDYLLYAQWHVVTYRVWYGFLFFGTLFSISQTKSETKAIWPYILLGALFFLLFYFELVYAVYVSIVCGLCAIWLHWRQPRKIMGLYIAQGIGGISALALLFFQLVSVFGLDVVATDYRITFLSRNAASGMESMVSLEEFFHNHNIVFWQNFRDGTLLRTIGAFVKSISIPIFQVWTPALFLLLSIPFLGILISFLEPMLNARPANVSAVRYRSISTSVSIFESIKIIIDRGPRQLLTISISGFSLRAFIIYVGTVAIYVGTVALVLVAVSLDGAVYGLQTALGTSISELVSALAISGVMISLAGLAHGYRTGRSGVMQIFRGALMGSLAAVLIAKNNFLYNQLYSDIWMPLYQNLEVPGIVKLAVFIMALAAVAIAAVGATNAFGLERKTSVKKALSFFGIGLFTYAFIYVLSPGYVMSGYAERLAPFAVFFVVALPAIAIDGLFVAGQRFGAWLFPDVQGERSKFGRWNVVSIGMALLIAVPVVLWARVQIYYARMFPPDQVSFAKILASPQFKNATIAVNNYAAIAAYYSGTWAYMDMKIGSASIQSEVERRRDIPGIWFADWKSNPEYAKPSYYVCMKIPTFGAILAQRDPKLYGGHFEFCGKEAILKESSRFSDQLVASDFKPPKFWSVVALAPAPRPQIVVVIVSAKGDSKGLEINYNVKAVSDAAYPVRSTEADLLIAPGVNQCRDAHSKLRRIQGNKKGNDFVLPKNFTGGFSVRARVQTEMGDSDWASGNIVIADPAATDPRGAIRRCGALIVDGSFGAGGLALQDSGWSTPESWGTWSVGNNANLLPIPFSGSIKNSDLIFQADVMPFIGKPGQTQSVVVLANGKMVANWLFTDANPNRIATALIPREVLTDDNVLSFSFKILNAISPLSLDISSDVRKLGIGFKAISLEEVRLQFADTVDTYVSMRNGVSGGSVAAAGWGPPSEIGVEAIDQSASIVIPVSEGHYSKTSIVVDADVNSEGDGRQPFIEVIVNGTVVGKLKNEHASTQFALPEHTYSTDERLFIEFQRATVPEAVLPSVSPLPLLLRGIHIVLSP